MSRSRWIRAGVEGRRERKVGFGKLGGKRTLALRPVHAIILEHGERAFAVLTWVKLEINSNTKL
ncbi:hypothetical protein BDZ45DRAFT_742099 [Acephala macrosclerotiorum]|nr:hypothetical protein BDZ45DRAFT_742099 [Acephala macrosclerotiorum]